MKNTENEAATDGGVTVELAQDELYEIVHGAVKDAVIDVLGTVFLLVFALLFVGAGVRGVFIATSTSGIALGGFIVVLGIAIAGAALDLVPPFRT